MKRIGIVVVGTAMVLGISSWCAADFVLSGGDRLDVATSHTTGVLYDASVVNVLLGGYIAAAYVNDDARLRLIDYRDGSGGDSVGQVYTHGASHLEVVGGAALWAYLYDGSGAEVSEGSVHDMAAYNSSAVDIVDGAIHEASLYDNARGRVIAGSIGGVHAYDSTQWEITGGCFASLHVHDTGEATVSGGRIDNVYAEDAGTIIIQGYDFRTTGGLTLDGGRLYGTGILTGQWVGGASWAMRISRNDLGAAILVLPEPATLAMLALGGVALSRRRRAR